MLIERNLYEWRAAGGIGGIAPDVNRRSGNASYTDLAARGTSRKSMAPTAGPFSCLVEALPARLKDKRLFRCFQNQKIVDMMKMRANIITIKLEIMNTRETLVLKTLTWKQTLIGSVPGGFVDRLLDENPEKADEITKNVCARIPLQLAQEMETVGNMLDLNKREIITMALNDFLEKARDTLTEFKAWPDDVEG